MTNTYNADNLRTTKTVGNTTTEYVWDGQNLVSETKQGTTDTYTNDMTGVHTRKHGNTVTSYLKDYHGNVIGTADSTGRLTRETVTTGTTVSVSDTYSDDCIS